MSFVRAKKSVDRETGRAYRHYQLVEDYWKDGRSQRRVLAHLGDHPTVEEATAQLRKRLQELEVKLEEHREEAGEYASIIVETYAAQLKKYHEGRIPSRREHHRRAWPKPWATETGRRYMRDFGRVEWKRSLLDNGRTYEAYSGYETFGSWVDAYWEREKKAAELRARVNELSAKLEKFEGLPAARPTDV